MKTIISTIVVCVFLVIAGGASAAVHYVDLNSANPIPPYTNWATAATVVQDAVDAAVAGDEVVVSNGIYATGGRAMYGTMTNRVAVDKPLSLQSVNGSQFTMIQGYQVPGTTNGDAAIRCVYLTNGASLSGFTLTNGATHAAWYNTAEDSGGGLWCESATAVVSNCVMVDNSAAFAGGGAFGGTIINSTLRGNSSNDGGGAAASTLDNCALTGNSALYGGGGTFVGSLSNCTLTANSADGGGGASGGSLNNCILYFNTAVSGANYDSYCTLSYCCTTPLPPFGLGNLSADPQLASDSHLSAASPCRGAGSADYTSGTDVDGEPWADPPSIGCDEYHPGAVTGTPRVSLNAAYTNAAVGFPIQCTALIEGRTTMSVWDFGDGSRITNQPYISHAWASPGNYPVVLNAYNESQLGGINATVAVHVVALPVHYVAADSPNPTAPYTTWATAATNIQDAVDAAILPGALVLVTNEIYSTGGRALAGTMTNRVAVDKPITLRSVNGPQVTVIQGYQVPGTTNGEGAVRCVYLTAGSSLSGFTLTNGATRALSYDYVGNLQSSGGGVRCESRTIVVSNCVLAGNSASIDGGGGYGGGLINCTLTGNSAGNLGGGAAYSTLNNCTLALNSAQGEAGGAGGCALNNCIVYYNTATLASANLDSAPVNYCCTTPDVPGLGNITNAPLFADLAGGNLHLQSNSPCINAGDNAYAVPGLPDLDGNPRIVSGTVDIGAYEYQGSGSIISYAWLQYYGLPTDGSVDFADPDGDGLNDWQEWRCGTNPTNALSALRMLTAAPAGTNVNVSWQSVAGVNYFLDRSTNLAASPAFTPLAVGIPGQAGTTSFTDTKGPGPGPVFYRVGVGN
jgi:PKD domain-containing protein